MYYQTSYLLIKNNVVKIKGPRVTLLTYFIYKTKTQPYYYHFLDARARSKETTLKMLFIPSLNDLANDVDWFSCNDSKITTTDINEVK